MGLGIAGGITSVPLGRMHAIAPTEREAQPDGMGMNIAGGSQLQQAWPSCPVVDVPGLYC